MNYKSKTSPIFGLTWGAVQHIVEPIAALILLALWLRHIA